MAGQLDAIQNNVRERFGDSWTVYMDNLHDSLTQMEQAVNEAREMPMDCDEDWCANARALLDDLNHAIFSIHEPRWSDKKDSDRIREMKNKVRDIYSDLKDVTRKVENLQDSAPDRLPREEDPEAR
jgi:hypothetical protein